MNLIVLENISVSSQFKFIHFYIDIQGLFSRLLRQHREWVTTKYFTAAAKARQMLPNQDVATLALIFHVAQLHSLRAMSSFIRAQKI